jgi:hypothetical protein
MKAQKIINLAESVTMKKSYKDDPDAFQTAFDAWLKIARDRLADHWKKNDYRFAPTPDLIVQEGNRYWKVIRKDSSQESVHAFVDTSNGDVLKPATWRAPAKHARGNIFDDDHGAAWIGPHGPNYLR